MVFHAKTNAYSIRENDTLHFLPAYVFVTLRIALFADADLVIDLKSKVNESVF